jgi:hypothetical protein
LFKISKSRPYHVETPVSRLVLFRPPPYGFYWSGPLLSAIAYNAFYFWFHVARATFHGAISPEARASYAPLYNASSILASVKTRLSIFVEQGKSVFDFFIKVINSRPCHVE